MIDIRENQRGFSLIELLVAMAIGIIVMGAIFSMYTTTSKTNMLQEQVAGMQQNLRASMFYMVREIRMAGCDPTINAGAGITTFDADSFGFTSDFRGTAIGSSYDGTIDDPNENITYTIDDSDDTIRRNGQPIANNIDALNFVYLDAAGNVTGTKSNIKAVQVTVVARTERLDQGYINQDGVFYNQQGDPIYTVPANDGFHRKTLTTNIRCRNL